MFVSGLDYFLIPSKTNFLSIASSSGSFAKIFHYNHGNSIELQKIFAIFYYSLKNKFLPISPLIHKVLPYNNIDISPGFSSQFFIIGITIANFNKKFLLLNPIQSTLLDRLNTRMLVFPPFLTI